MNERLKQAREYLKLSQEFVAYQTGLHPAEINAIEAGIRNVSDRELSLFSKLYGVDEEILKYGEKQQEEKNVLVEKLARYVGGLSPQDLKELRHFVYNYDTIQKEYKEKQAQLEGK